jgi:hypothetical protein
MFASASGASMNGMDYGAFINRIRDLRIFKKGNKHSTSVPSHVQYQFNQP